MKNLICIEDPKTVIKLTKQECEKIGINPNEDNRAEIEALGPWSVIRSFKALCVNNTYDDSGFYTKKVKTEIFGLRKMSNIKQEGYGISGRVSVNGIKYEGFNSSITIEVEGKFIEVETINIRS